MVQIDKVYLMTKAAVFEETHKDVLQTVSYRRKDYILYHMMGIMLSVTAAYAAIIGTVMFMIVMAHEELILNTAEALVIAVGVILIYVIILVIYYLLSHKYYGEKHVAARRAVTEYLSYLREIHEMDENVRYPLESGMDISGSRQEAP